MRPSNIPTEDLESHLPRLRAVVARVAGSRHADDLVQECCVRILENAGSFRGDRSGASGWMATIAANLSRTFLRQTGARSSVSLDHESPAPKDQDDVDERLGWILSQIARLPESDREVLRLRFFEGLTVEEVGAALGVSQSTASMKIKKTLSKLESRARRQGLFGTFMPLPLAGALAGTGPGKALLAGSTAVALTAACASPYFFTVEPGTALHGNTSDLDSTSFALVLDTPLDPNTNLIWCGTNTLAWNALADAIGSQVDPSELEGGARLLANDPFDEASLDPSSFVASGGPMDRDWIEETQEQLIAKFGARDPYLDQLDLKAGWAMGYSFLAKDLPFTFQFTDLGKEPHFFGEGRVDVEAFGSKPPIDPAVRFWKLAEQVNVFHYESKDEFCLEFRPEGGDRIIVAEMPPQPTLDATWRWVESRRAAYGALSPSAQSSLSWKKGERLVIPKLDFDLNHSFPSMTFGPESKYPIEATQRIRVRLDHRGAKIRSRSSFMILGSAPLEPQPPKELVVDRPFLVAFIEEDAPQPYALVWVGRPELLVPRSAASSKGTGRAGD